MKDLELIINTSELTAGTRGSGLGPDAVIAVARSKGSTFFRDHAPVRVEDVNFMLDQDVKYPFARRIEGLVNIFERVSNTVSSTLEHGKFPLILAGDHGSAGGTIAGIKAAFPDKRLGVIWIDAHGDLHTPYTTPSGNMHGMPLATALGEDNLECQSNTPHPNVVKYWNALKNTGIEGPKLSPQDLIFIGVRDTEEQEDAIIERHGIRNHTVADVRLKGAEEIARLCIEQLEHCEMVYVSFDVDSMDPELASYGTGTPVAIGLSPDEAKVFLHTFACEEKLVCMEFVEVNPCLDDKKNRMAEITFELLEVVVDSIKN